MSLLKWFLTQAHRYLDIGIYLVFVGWGRVIAYGEQREGEKGKVSLYNINYNLQIVELSDKSVQGAS